MLVVAAVEPAVMPGVSSRVVVLHNSAINESQHHCHLMADSMEDGSTGGSR
jgi:hypothetical protein